MKPSNPYERRLPPGALPRIDVEKLGRIGREGHRVNGDCRILSVGK
jgi:hypothetical protein